MIGKYTRLLAALLVFAPTSLSSAEATAGQRDNGRGFRVIAGDTHGAYRKHRRQNKRIRAVAVKFSASTHGSNGVSRFERLEPLQLYPVSSFQKVTTRQLTIGQQRAQLRASLGRPDPETGWIVINKSGSDENGGLRIEYQDQNIKQVAKVKPRAIVQSNQSVLPVSSDDLAPIVAPAKPVALQNAIDEENPLVVYFDD